ncbi:MAG: ATP-binding cassette domain-containing protein [Desulfovibrionaceae bacterium]
MTPVYEFIEARKNFFGPGETLEIFQKINLVIGQSESLAIVGASGSGKSTLLHLMGALDTLSSGKILFEGKDLATMSPDTKAHLRNTALGFVFQFHHLLPEFSTVENVAMQAIIGHMPRKQAFAKAEEMLVRVGLEDRLEHKVTTLSGGERQRAAIARAILMRPRVLLADEPTGNLDDHTGKRVGELLVELNRELGMTLVIVTHNRELAACMGRSLELRSGVLYDQKTF